MFYDPAKTLSHNCMMNFVVSERGSGKSFSTLLFLIKKFKQSGDQFVYIRRTEVELDLSRPKLFNAIENEGMIKPSEFTCEGDFIFHNTFDEKGNVIEKDVCGYSLALSKVRQYKSVAFPKVKYIFLEEFIDENNKYIKNEVENLISIIETIARLRFVQVICLGNLITKYNPYFTYFNINYDSEKEFIKDKKKGILVHTFKSLEYRRKKKETPFAKLIEGTEYGCFILNNSNILDNDDLIKKVKVKNKVPYCNFILEKSELCCYILENNEESSLYIDNNHNKSAPYFINMDERLKENYHNLGKNNVLTQIISRYSRISAIYFATGVIKNSIQELIRSTR